MAIINGILGDEEELAETPEQESTEPPSEDIAEGETPEAPAKKAGPNDATKRAIKQLLAAAMHIMYAPKYAQKLIELVRSSSNKEGAIAKMVFVAAMTLGRSAKGVPPKVIIKLCKPMTMMAFEILSKAGVLKPTPNMMYRVLKHLNEAFSRMTQRSGKSPLGQQPAGGTPARPTSPQAAPTPMRPGAPQAAPMQPGMPPRPGGGLIQSRMGM